MRLINARVQGFGVLRDVVLDLGDYECGEIIQLAGENGVGKCLPAATRVYTRNGPITIREAVESRAEEVLGYVAGRICPVGVTEWHSLGEKPLVRIIAQGWPIECATTHPILTDTGWRRASEIRPGDFIAAARTLPINGAVECSAEEAELAGLMIGDASMTEEALLCASDPDKVAAFERVASAVFPGCGVTKQRDRVILTRGQLSRDQNAILAQLVASAGFTLDRYLKGEAHNNVSRFLRGESGLAAATFFSMLDDGVPAEHMAGHFAGQKALTRWAMHRGLMGHRAAGKSLGAFEGIATSRIGDLLRGLWITDGYVSADAREVSYCTASELLSRQIRELLLRGDILCSRREKRVNGRVYYNVSIYQASVGRFAALAALPGKKGARLAARPVKCANINRDALPFSVWSGHHVSGATAWRHSQRGMSRETFIKLGGPAAVAAQEVSWLQVDEVYSLGAEPCFDLGVATTEHAYVAECTVVHNSSLLELAIPGAVYRQCPTRGSLRDLARERNSNLDVSLSHAGKVYHIRHVVDAVSGKSEALLRRSDGTPVLDTTKVKDFGEWVSRTFIAPEVLLACTFGSQASGGFLAAKPTERKAILLRSLGLEAWETRAERAAEKAKAVDVALTKARAKLEALGADDPDAEQRATEAAERLTQSNQRLTAARHALALFEGDIQRNQELRDKRLALTGEHGRLVAELSFANDRRKSLLQDISDVRAAMGEADAIREANTRLTTITAELEQLRDKRATAAATLQSVKRELQALPLPNSDAQRDLDEATLQLQSIETARAVQSEELDRLIALHADAMAEWRTCDNGVSALRAQFESLSATRIEGLRGGLTRIAAIMTLEEQRLPLLSQDNATLLAFADRASQSSRKAREALDRDDALVSVTTEARLTELTALRDDAGYKAGDVKLAKDSAELNLERLQLQWDDASRRVTRLKDEVAKDEEQAAARDRKVTALEEQLQRLEAELQENVERSDALSAEAEKLKPLAAKLLVLEKATATLAGLEGSLARESSRAEADAARAAEIVEQLTRLEHAKVPSYADATAQRHVLQQEVDAANAEHNDNHGAYAEAKLGWERQQATAADRVALTSQVASLELELSDWTRLKDDLGKNGIQAAEIDGALDDLNVLVNDLLHECHGSRWTVRLDTQRLSGDGKRMIETLDVVILDTETGREGKAETFSGGERAILGEALALALTMVACRRAGLERPTLVRDESGAALDPANARAYIAMLRRAAKYVEASCVLVVSHQPDIAELCDARIEVTQGRHVAEAAE